MSDSTSARWFLPATQHAEERYRLYCFPCAGGGHQLFHPFRRRVDPSITLCLVSLPGRGGRIGEPPLTDMSSMVEALAEALVDREDRPFAFFGYSLGALVAFELARRLRTDERPLPSRLFVAACRAPQRPPHEPLLHNLPDDRFIDEIRRIGGTPPEIFESPELIEIVLPALRADFEILETRTYSEEPPLSTPITAFGGKNDDHVSLDALQDWQYHTNSEFRLLMLEGNHFFLDQHSDRILDEIQQSLVDHGWPC